MRTEQRLRGWIIVPTALHFFRILLFFWLCLAFSPTLTSQNLPATLRDYMEGDAYEPPAVLMGEEVSFDDLLVATTPWRRDSFYNVRDKAYQLLYNKAIQSGEVADRRAFIRASLDVLIPEEKELALQNLLQYLQKFNRTDYTEAHRQGVRGLLTSGRAFLHTRIMLAGFVLDEEAPFLPFLDPATSPFPLSAQDQRAVRLALARQGNAAYLEDMLRNIKKIPVGDDFVYQVAPMLVYVRQKAATDYLLELISSDEPNCSPADAETAGNIPCAYRLMELVAPVIVDFPFALDVSGDLDTADYPGALRQVRAWIVANQENYQLRRDIY